MATVNFSVPETVKREFQKTFANENKSAIIARLMQQAIDERRREQAQSAAIDKLLELRSRQAPVTDAEIRRARRFGRP
jgi:hypothetical protein